MLRTLSCVVLLIAAQSGFAQEEMKKLEQLSDQFPRQQEQYDKRVKELNDEMVSLQAKINQLTQNASSVEDLKKILQTTSDRITTIEELMKKQDERRNNAAAMQYKTALATMNVMNSGSEKLDFLTQLIHSVNEFNGLMNPANSPEFLTAVNSLSVDGKGWFGKGRSITEVLPAAVLSNTNVVGAVLIGSLMRNASDAPAEKDVRYLMCYISGSSDSQESAKLLNLKIAQVNERVMDFKKELKSSYQPFFQTVENDMTYERYQNARQNQAGDPMDAAIEKFFGLHAESGSDAEKMANTRFQIEKVRRLLASYDQVLNDMDEFLISFKATISNHRSIVQSKMVAKAKNGMNCDDILQPLDKALAKLESQAGGYQSKFRSAFREDISMQSRSILYGAN